MTTDARPGGHPTDRPGRPGRSQERRRSLLEAADRVVRRSGPEAAMAAIAAEAGVTKPVLYRHFGDKGGLYRALADRHIVELMSRLQTALRRPADPQQRTRLVVDAYLAAIEEEPQIYRFLLYRAPLEEPTLTGLVAELSGRVAGALSSGIMAELGMPEDSRPTALAWAHGMVGAVQAAGDWWLQTREVPRERVVDDLCTLLNRGWTAASPTDRPAPEAEGYQPRVPGAPLNGPTTFEVIQPP